MFFRPEIKLIAIGTCAVVRAIGIDTPSPGVGFAFVKRISVFAHSGTFVDISTCAVFEFIPFATAGFTITRVTIVTFASKAAVSVGASGVFVTVMFRVVFIALIDI